MVKGWNEGQAKIKSLLASEVGRYSVLHFLYSPEKSLYFLSSFTVTLLQGVPFSSSRKSSWCWKTSACKLFRFQHFAEVFLILVPNSASLQSCASFHFPYPWTRQTPCPWQPPGCEGGGGKWSRKPELEAPGGAASCLRCWLKGRRC